MAWIKIQAGLVTNKKTARLAGLMKWRKLEAVGFLVSFWIWALENCEDGQLRDISDNELAFAVGMESADGVLKALISAHLVDTDPLRIHEWPVHQNDYLRSKYRKSPEKIEQVQRQYRTSTVPVPDISRVEIGREGVTTSVAPAKPAAECGSGFPGFWEAYPKKTGKDKAAAAWKKRKPSLDDCLAALAWQIHCPQWTKEGGQYIPLPTTYINQGRWKDEPVRTKIETGYSGGH